MRMEVLVCLGICLCYGLLRQQKMAYASLDRMRELRERESLSTLNKQDKSTGQNCGVLKG